MTFSTQEVYASRAARTRKRHTSAGTRAQLQDWGTPGNKPPTGWEEVNVQAKRHKVALTYFPDQGGASLCAGPQADAYALTPATALNAIKALVALRGAR